MPEMLFLFDRPEAVAAWSAIDDRVMGGVSRSALRFESWGASDGPYLRLSEIQ